MLPYISASRKWEGGITPREVGECVMRGLVEGLREVLRMLKQTLFGRFNL